MDFVRYHFETIDSTNTWAKQNVHKFEKDKITIISAEEQTAGRGRFTRRWESPKGLNVYTTFAFYLEKYSSLIGNIPQVLAMSAVEALAELGFIVKLKWPNDLMIQDEKLGGVLCETTAIDNGLFVIAGIGINVNMPQELLQKIDRPATSLLKAGGSLYSIEKVIENLQKYFVRNLEILKLRGFKAFHDAYQRDLMYRIGDPLSFNDFRTIWEGFFHSIKEDGSLNLKLPSGEIKNFLSGEIF